MSDHKSSALKVCPECAAHAVMAATKCWLCGAEFRPGQEIVLAEIQKPPPSAISERICATATALISLLILLMGIGIGKDEPGLSIVYFVIVAPGLLITAIRPKRSRGSDENPTWGDRLVTLIISMSLTVLACILLMVAAIAALFVICLFEQPNFH